MERYQNIYQSAREGAGLTQEKAAEMLGWSVRNLQAIEQEDRTPTPVRVAEMAEAYRAPWLRGYITATGVRWGLCGGGRKAMWSCSNWPWRSAWRARTTSRSVPTRTIWR